MLTQKEIDEVIKNIDLGYSDYKIGTILKHSPSTIKKIKDDYHRGKYNKGNVKELMEEGKHFDYPSEKIKDLIEYIDNIKEKVELPVYLINILDKTTEELREMLRTEVDGRIPGERAAERKATEGEKDEYWKGQINEFYVLKKDAMLKDGRIKELEDENSNIRYKFSGHANELFILNGKIMKFGKANEDLFSANVDLTAKNTEQQNFIDTRLDDAGRRETLVCIEKLQELAREKENSSKREKELVDFFNKRSQESDERERRQDEREKKILADIEKNEEILEEIQKKELKFEKILKTVEEKHEENVLKEKNFLFKVESEKLKHERRMNDCNSVLERIREERRNLNVTKEELREIRMLRLSKRLESVARRSNDDNDVGATLIPLSQDLN